jgi:hypothetical protein
MKGTVATAVDCEDGYALALPASTCEGINSTSPKCRSDSESVSGKHRQAILPEKKEIEAGVSIIGLLQVLHYRSSMFLLYHIDCCKFH